MLDDVNWPVTASASVLAGLLSLLISVAGLPELDDGNSLRYLRCCAEGTGREGVPGQPQQCQVQYLILWTRRRPGHQRNQVPLVYRVRAVVLCPGRSDFALQDRFLLCPTELLPAKFPGMRQDQTQHRRYRDSHCKNTEGRTAGIRTWCSLRQYYAQYA